MWSQTPQYICLDAKKHELFTYVNKFKIQGLHKHKGIYSKSNVNNWEYRDIIKKNHIYFYFHLSGLHVKDD